MDEKKEDAKILEKMARMYSKVFPIYKSHIAIVLSITEDIEEESRELTSQEAK